MTSDMDAMILFGKWGIVRHNRMDDENSSLSFLRLIYV
jgi:hypothetical protein